jgi:hypothetical protein
MVSGARDLAYLFVTSGRAGELGLVAKVVVPLTLLVPAVAPYLVPGAEARPSQPAVLVVYELLVLGYVAGVRRVSKMVSLVVLFLGVALALSMLSSVLGTGPPDPMYSVSWTLRLLSIVLALSMLFQLLTVGEVRYLLMRLGLRWLSEVVSVAIAQLPVVLISFSEATVAAVLKLGGRRVSAVVKPLVVDAVVISRQVAEALYLHGLPPAPRPALIRGATDVYLILGALIASSVSALVV